MSGSSASVAIASSDSAMDTRLPGPGSAAMSVDVEDWFQVENLKPAIPRESWDSRERRVERNTMRILEILAEHQAKATFFVLGWVADRHPELIRRIAELGHEIACHGYGHELLYKLSEAEFRADVDRCKKILEDVTGQAVVGYRAPSFSITDWAVTILQEMGFEYDSSVFPTVAHDRYGRLTGVDAAHPILELRPGFYEVCISCLPLGSRGLPWGGGGYFRMIPYLPWRAGVRRILGTGSPYVFYIHPWEIDPAQPRVGGLDLVNRVRHYINLGRCEERFRALVSGFQWSTVGTVLEKWKAREPLPT
ncbi:MAG TPA: XrtA system polysaccharide deacetylase [Gemmatimonadales bacterium]|jgi:polysaccharide deacetylase family protein (PEP-CTERM system associated)|nr:XrtA system polysaccharide deacetylase [Gemmatimonadales bacterium]